MLDLVLICCNKKPLEIAGRGEEGSGRKDTCRTAETGRTVLAP